MGNPIRVSIDVGDKTFSEALTGFWKTNLQLENEGFFMMRPLSTPRYEGGNLIMDLDKKEYMKGVGNLKFSVVGQIYLKRGASFPTTMDLKSKLGELWGTQTFKLLPMGSNHYH